MQTEFDRVEKLLAANIELKEHDIISENPQPQFVKQYGNNHTIPNRYSYAKWTLWFFLILILGVMIQIYVGQYADQISNILQYLHLKK